VTVRLARASTKGDSSANITDASSRVTCALVNNMPDSAFDTTERQYLGLLEAGSGSRVIDVRRYAMTGVPRGAQTSARISEQYHSLASLYLDPPDVLIVTGSNPIEARIEDELYWSDLIELLTWAQVSVTSTLLSCLAAHAALTIFDGIARVRLSTKCTGVFSHRVKMNQTLTAGFESEVRVPHSRWNTVPREALERANYDVLVHSESTGWGIASREGDGRQLVLVQSHPEYDPSSLLREYRRDAQRFVNRERDDAPCLPYHCVAEEDWEPLERMHREIIDARDPLLIERFPFDEVGARAPWSWRSMAGRFYANWLTSVVEDKE
jgi:homoserine O-succinyltransferase/O-acetyltransferase